MSMCVLQQYHNYHCPFCVLSHHNYNYSDEDGIRLATSDLDSCVSVCDIDALTGLTR